MSKPATRKPGVKRRRKSGWDIDRRSIEAEWEAALLQISEEILREEIAFWSWPDTPEGQPWIEISDKLEVLMKDVGKRTQTQLARRHSIGSRSIHSAYQETVSLLSRRQDQGVSDLLPLARIAAAGDGRRQQKE
jgi:hypothetical protein